MKAFNKEKAQICRIDVEIGELKLNNSKIRVYVIFSVHSRSHDV